MKLIDELVTCPPMAFDMNVVIVAAVYPSIIQTKYHFRTVALMMPSKVFASLALAALLVASAVRCAFPLVRSIYLYWLLMDSVEFPKYSEYLVLCSLPYYPIEMLARLFAL